MIGFTKKKRLTPFNMNFPQKLSTNFFILLGFLFIIISPIITLMNSLGHTIIYLIIFIISLFLKRPMNLPFLPFIFGLTLRLEVLNIVFGLILILYGYFWEVLLYIGYLWNKRIIKYFSHLYGTDWNDLIKDTYLGSEISICLNVGIFVCISWFILNKDIYDRFSVFLFMLTGPALTYSIYILLCNSRLGSWAFYQIKKIIIPYIFITIFASFISSYIWLILYYLTFFFGFRIGEMDSKLFSRTSYVLYGNETVLPELKLTSHFIYELFNPKFSFIEVIGLIIISTMLVLFAMWVISIVIRKDYTQLILLFVLIVSSLFSEKIYLFYIGILELFPIQMKLHPFLIIILFSFLIDQLFGKIKDLIIRSIACQRCGLRLKNTELHCPNCGLKNMEAVK